MNNKIKTLEILGQNLSIKQFETAHEMLLSQGFSDEKIDNISKLNTPMVCTWAPDEDDNDKDKRITH